MIAPARGQSTYRLPHSWCRLQSRCFPITIIGGLQPPESATDDGGSAWRQMVGQAANQLCALPVEAALTWVADVMFAQAAAAVVACDLTFTCMGMGTVASDLHLHILMAVSTVVTLNLQL